ncbi:uncharacterized protein [Hetaerina americana]|uniref:uncharacterized protein n=1 Tax=Hetaerina americana TaxID=62018 RepID=UPI003A7F5702
MEALLPSEISRLILGYLEEQACTAAYQTFLETCPHLKECAEAALQGMRFSTRAAGRSLRDILNEYCLIYTIVQDRIQKLPENTASQLKAYGISLADQVKQLIDGKQTGQRFHVNITVPTQSKNSKPRLAGSGTYSSPGSSHHMVTPTSSRMRRLSHPLQEQRLTLRSQDPKEDVTASVTVQRVETTQLENLPGSTVSMPSNMGQTIRKNSHSGSRNHLVDVDASFVQEEENSSLLDPKTGELTSPPACQSTDVVGSVSSTAKDTNTVSDPDTKSVESNLSVKNALSPRQSVDTSGSSKTAVVDLSSSRISDIRNESGSGRSSLDKLLINILSTHEDG